MGRSRFRFEPNRTLAAGSIGAGYTIIGTAFEHPVDKIIFMNLTDANISFSLDGINETIELPKEAVVTLDIAMRSGETCYISKGDAIYAKQVGVPATGKVSASVFYNEEVGG